MPRHQVTMVVSSLIALSSTQNLVFLRMIRKIMMISAGPAANAVVMKRIGIMLWNHIGRAGMVEIRKAVTVWIDSAQTIATQTSGMNHFRLIGAPVYLHHR